MDLPALYAKFRAVPGEAGRPGIDPRILLALWLFATIEGVSSARQLDRLSERDLAYLWICGEVKVNYHTNAERGYILCTVTPGYWRSDYMVVDDVLQPGGRTFSRAAFVGEDGDPRVTNA